MSPGVRFAVGVSLSAIVLGAEAWIIYKVIPWSALTEERINNFMLISMGMAFIPLLLLVIIVPVLIGVLLFVAYLPAHVFWARTSKRYVDPQSPRARMLRRMEELKKMTPERERVNRESRRDA